jgi:8-oxo-dGTP diphosphatase
MDPVRNSAKAIIIDDDRLLVIRHVDAEGEWFSLPGGGQNSGEPLTEALRRECLEELGVAVDVGPLRLVREYIGANHEFVDEHLDLHTVDFMFECSLRGQPDAGLASQPDPRQVGTAWLRLSGLRETRLYPKTIRGLLASGIRSATEVYLGDIN